MEPNSLVKVIQEFIARNGDRYPAREQPYLYGELPHYVRDNRQFVVPVEEVITTVEQLNIDINTKVINKPVSIRELKPVVVTSTVIEKPETTELENIVEEKPVEEKLEKPVEVEAPVAVKTSRKRKAVE